jgi:hypothetical protein
VGGSKETAAAVDAMDDLNEHPEAPGGEFDLPLEPTASLDIPGNFRQ